jgi:tRNA-splicing ligase RtcB
MTQLNQIEEYVWEIPKAGDMRVPGRIYADREIINGLLEEERSNPNWNSLSQIKNVATLPGIQKFSLALADVHCGYGAPIGGVVAEDVEEGVITFGAIGFDINCGVRSILTPFYRQDIEKKKHELAEALFRKIPAGLGSTGKLSLSIKELDEMLVEGSEYALKIGYGFRSDLEFTEMGGKVEGAKPENVSTRAKQRQFKQMGTLGSGNHYLEVQYVEQIFDEEAARAYGLEPERVVVSIHCGSRALGHQTGMDYLQELAKATKKYNIKIKDRELVCAPIKSPEGERYYSAVAAGMNCAFANRQILTHLTRQTFAKVMGCDEKEIRTLYDVGHNTAKFEEHDVYGEKKMLLVHRKGSTRGFGPNRQEVPEKYRKVGQPIIVGGTMGTSSFILRGTEKGMEETFGSGVHGAGRIMSRRQATRQFRGEQIIRELAKQGIVVKAHSYKGTAEEAPGAYKNIEDVVKVVDATGVNKKVVRLKPMIVIKG